MGHRWPAGQRSSLRIGLLTATLATIEGAFDQVVLVDTGSEDRTVDVFTAWAEAEQLPMGFKIESFEWCDDFGAAREFADSLLATDWLANADASDEIWPSPDR